MISESMFRKCALRVERADPAISPLVWNERVFRTGDTSRLYGPILSLSMNTDRLIDRDMPYK
jgi:hypothetical protein